MLALADDAALARLVIAATRIRTYRRGQWLRRPLPAPGSAKHRSLVGQSRRTIGSCSQTQAATVATDHHHCGTFDAYKIYARLDIIEHDGGSYIAVRDDPGTIPGEDGWQLLARPGRRGPVGDTEPRGRKGERGARGENASTIIAWTLDTKNYRAIPTMSNGRAGAPLDLRPLFEQFCEEAIAPAVAAALTAALKDAARNPNLFAPL